MGTDIHLFVEEVLSPPLYAYLHTDEPLFVWRDYEAFRTISNVRGGAGALRNGFPEAVSPRILEYYRDDNYHDVSWMTANEMRIAFQFASPEPLYSRSHLAQVIAPWCHEKWRAIEPRYLRFVYFFDN
jgi:hypothetical protein